MNRGWLAVNVSSHVYVPPRVLLQVWRNAVFRKAACVLCFRFFPPPNRLWTYELSIAAIMKIFAAEWRSRSQDSECFLDKDGEQVFVLELYLFQSTLLPLPSPFKNVNISYSLPLDLVNTVFTPENPNFKAFPSFMFRLRAELTLMTLESLSKNVPVMFVSENYCWK